MNLKTLEAVYSALLLPVGKMAFRAGLDADESLAGTKALQSFLKDDAWQAVIEGAQCAHASLAAQAAPSVQPIAYLLCLAQEISAVSSFTKM